MNAHQQGGKAMLKQLKFMMLLLILAILSAICLTAGKAKESSPNFV
jgi:hypothetical protein